MSNFAATTGTAKTKELRYKLKNAKCIFDYYEQRVGGTTSVAADAAVSSKSRSILAFFTKPQPTDLGVNQSAQHFAAKTAEMAMYRYMRNVGESPSYYEYFATGNQTRICRQCGRGEMIVLDDEGLMVCNKCSVSEPFLVDNDNPSYKEPPKETGYYAYRRINHFKEIKLQLQGKEITNIKPEWMDMINSQLVKERIPLKRLTYKLMKDILKRLELSKLYDHINYILFVKLELPRTIVFPQWLDELLDVLFIELQEPYSVVCPHDRTNFLHYNYVLYKLIELISMAGHISPEQTNQYLSNIPMLVDHANITDQDNIWNPMCAILDWEFVPTVIQIWWN